MAPGTHSTGCSRTTSVLPPLPPQRTVASGFDNIFKSSREALPKCNVGSTWFSELRYSAFGETRYSSGITATDYRYTGQLQQADINLYYYNARFYDPALGRFVQADSLIPGIYDLKSWDSYAYVGNNPIRYNDPTGHDKDCGIGDPYCQNLKPRMADPNKSCMSNIHCMASYKTIAEIGSATKRKPSAKQILGMTATAEYYGYIYYEDAGSLRKDGQNALARNLYQASKDNPYSDREGKAQEQMTDNQIYWFLSGYEAWWRLSETSVNRANNLMSSVKNNKYEQELSNDIDAILHFGNAQKNGWTQGNISNEPWQWINKTYPPESSGSYNSNKGAILYIVISGSPTYGGNYFWVVTGRQDYCNKPDHGTEAICN